jgi:hypothetical protein
MDKRRLVLADGVGVIGGLLISTRVGMDDRIGGGQAQDHAACLEADEEHRHIAFLEPLDRAGLIGRLSERNADHPKGACDALASWRHDGWSFASCFRRMTH